MNCECRAVNGELSDPPGRAGCPRQLARATARVLPALLILFLIGSSAGCGDRIGTPNERRVAPAAENLPRRQSWTHLGEYRVTAYCACEKCCGRWSDGHFADGTSCADKSLLSVAAPPEVPLGATLYLEGVGPVIVRDRGGAIKGQRLDLFHATHQEALEWGVQERRVWILARAE